MWKLWLQFESMEFSIKDIHIGKIRRKAKVRNFTGKAETWILVPILFPVCYQALGKSFQLFRYQHVQWMSRLNCQFAWQLGSWNPLLLLCWCLSECRVKQFLGIYQDELERNCRDFEELSIAWDIIVLRIYLIWSIKVFNF